MRYLLIVLTIALLTSCKQNCKLKQNENQEDLIGKNVIITYPDFTAEIAYLSDSTLHWKTTTKNGEVKEGNEKVYFKKISNQQYFINWIENDGLTISQVVNLENNKVIVFGTFADEASNRGKRASFNLEGTLKIVK